MAEPTVATDTGTVTTPEPVVQAPVVADVKETPKPTFAETERSYKEQFDKERGRDLTKLFPKAIKKEEPKPEVKVDAAAEPAKVETKEETVVPKPRSGAGRLKLKYNLAKQENESLKARLAAIESRLSSPAKVETKAEPAVVKEPERKDFADDAAYFTAIRKFDKDQREIELKAEREERLQTETATQATRRYNEWQGKLTEVIKSHKDWDEVTSKVTVQFNPILEGCLMTADPEFLYYSATHQKEVKNLNDLNEQSVVAVGTSDDIAGVMRYLSHNPSEIDVLNVLSAEKAARFIGKIEAKIEAESKEVVKPATIVEDKRTSSGADDKSKKTVTAATEDVKPKVETKVEEPKPPQRARPEPPAKLTGGTAPSETSWTDPASMSIKDRERHFHEDPRFARRR